MDPAPETRPTLDRSVLLPILLGIFSLLGILLVFLIGRMNSDRNALPPEDTATPFRYQLIGTEPGISTAEPLATEPPAGEEPSGGESGSPGLVVTAQQGSSGSGSSSGTSPTKTRTPSSAIRTAAGNATDPIIILNPGTKTATSGLVVIERSRTPTRTPGPTITPTASRTKNVTSTGAPASATSSGSQVPLTAGTYDDSHPLISYDGWSSITDASAYQSTLHVSTTAGSTITFRFTGQQIRLTFQGSSSFGTIEINIGGLNFDLDESNGTDEWVSALLTQGTYTVTITHLAGGSVNIDSIIIPDFNTPTPTLTPTNGG